MNPEFVRTKEELDEIILGFLSGQSLEELSKEFRMSKATIRRLAKATVGEVVYKEQLFKRRQAAARMAYEAKQADEPHAETHWILTKPWVRA